MMQWQPVFTEADRQQMLADIARTALAIGRDLFPGAMLGDADAARLLIGGADTPSDISPRERVAYVVAVWPQLSNALHRIELSPDTLLRPETRLVPIERAVRASPKDLMTALVRGTPRQDAPRRVPERTSAPTTDTPANRLIKMLLALLLRDMTAAAELAAVVNAAEVERDALRLRERLRQVLRRDLWRTLPLPERSGLSPLPQSVWHNGAYRLIYDAFRRYRQGFAFDWRNPIFHLTSREMWLLYEYWCVFQVANALQTLGYQAVGADGFLISRSGLTFTLVRGTRFSACFHRCQRPPSDANI